jgi:hypothetical protein
VTRRRRPRHSRERKLVSRAARPRLPRLPVARACAGSSPRTADHCHRPRRHSAGRTASPAAKAEAGSPQLAVRAAHPAPAVRHAAVATARAARASRWPAPVRAGQTRPPAVRSASVPSRMINGRWWPGCGRHFGTTSRPSSMGSPTPTADTRRGSWNACLRRMPRVISLGGRVRGLARTRRLRSR